VAVSAALVLGSILLLNRGFYGFLLRARGAWFTLRAVPLHMSYFLYSGVTFVVCWIREGPYRRRHKRPARRLATSGAIRGDVKRVGAAATARVAATTPAP